MKLATKKKKVQSEVTEDKPTVSCSVTIVEGKTPPEDPLVAWRDRDGALHLAKLDFNELSAARNKFQLMRAQASSMRMQADNLEAKAAMKIAALRNEATVVDGKTEDARHIYDIKATQVWKKYGLEANKVGWDDDTGKVTQLQS